MQSPGRSSLVLAPRKIRLVQLRRIDSVVGVGDRHDLLGDLPPALCASAQFGNRPDVQVPVRCAVSDPAVVRLPAPVTDYHKPIFPKFIGAALGNDHASDRW
jgi:hypothetical protein